MAEARKAFRIIQGGGKRRRAPRYVRREDFDETAWEMLDVMRSTVAYIVADARLLPQRQRAVYLDWAYAYFSTPQHGDSLAVRRFYRSRNQYLRNEVTARLEKLLTHPERNTT